MSRLDVYIQSVMSRMGLEEPQRAEIEKELRAPLERAVETGLGKGLTRDQAERHALQAAKNSSFLLKHLGIPSGSAWDYFEYFTTLIWMIIITCLIVVIGLKSWQSWIFLLSLWMLLYGYPLLQMFRRVELSDGLEVHRFPKKPRRIPFDRIKRVRLPRLSLLATRVVIETDDASVELDRRFNGFPIAAVALLAFASEKIDRNARRYLEKARCRIYIPQESSTMHRVFTLLWACVLLGFFIAIRPVWWGFGFGLLLPIVLIAANVLIYLQHYTHKETVKKGLTQLLALILLVSIATLSYAAIGESSLARWLSVVALAMITGAMVILWWRWSCVFLLGVFALGAIPVLLSLYLFPSLYCKELKPLVLRTASWRSSNFQILGSEGPIVWLDYYRENTSGNVTQALKAVYLNGKMRSLKLEKPGHWELMSPTPLQEPSVLRKIPHHPEPIREVHIYDQEISAATKVVTLPPGIEPSWLHFSLFSIWSPDAKYLITSTRTYEREVINVNDGSVTRIGKRFYPFEWVDGKTLLARLDPRPKLHEADDSTSAGLPNSIELWKFDVEKGSKELFVRRALTENEKCQTTLPGLKYAIIYYYETPPPAGVPHEQPPDLCFVMHIETGETFSVPIPSGFLFLFSSGWNKEKEILAYAAAPKNNGEGPRIVVVNLKAKYIKERKFSVNEGIENVSLSPDAKKILFNHTLKNDALLRRFSRLDLWDIEKDKITPVRSIGVFGPLFAVFISFNQVWSPDSTWFAYPFEKLIPRGHRTIEVVKVP